jgi:glycosyltransferase involved in cell wall biosynthesis
MPSASILIPVKNESGRIGACLEAVFAQQGAAFEVIAVDSGSTDGTLDILRRYPLRLVQIAPGEFHHARTRNHLASLAAGDFLVFLGGDAVPASPNWLEALLAPFADAAVGAVYGRQLPREGASLERQAALALMYGDQPIRKHRDQLPQLGYMLYHFSTVTCAIRREVWRQYPFREDIPVFEDMAFAKQYLDAGGTILYVPDGAVRHSHDYPMGKLFRRFYDTGAVYQRLGIWQAGAGQHRTLLRDGLSTVGHKLARLRREPVGRIGVDLGRDLLKFVGIQLGRRERWLPMPLKRRFSCFGIYDSPARGAEEG